MLVIIISLGLIPLQRITEFQRGEKQLLIGSDIFEFGSSSYYSDYYNNLLGRFYRERFFRLGAIDDYQKSLLAFLHAIKINPIKASNYFSLADTLGLNTLRPFNLRMEKWALLRAHELDPNNILYIVALARYFYSIDELENAMNYLKLAHKLSPDVLFYFLISPDNQFEDIHPLTVRLLRNNIEKDPSNWRLYYKLAYSYYYNAMPRKAIKILEEGIEKTKENGLRQPMWRFETFVKENEGF